MISEKAKRAIKDSELLKGRLADALGRSVSSVNRWVYENDTLILTTAIAVQIIKEETGLTEDEILAREEAEKLTLPQRSVRSSAGSP